MNTPPENEISNATHISKKASSVKAIAYGALIDLGGSLSLGILIGIVYAIALTTQGIPSDQVAQKMQSLDHWSLVGILGTTAGTLFSFLGGYVCASKSLININRDTAILSIISSCAGLVIGIDAYSFIENVFLAVLTIVAIFLGAKLWQKKNSSFS